MPMHDLNCHHPKPKFSRMHYQMVAETLASEKPYASKTDDSHSWFAGTIDEWHTVCLAFVKLFTKDNHLFDRERFLMWCNNRPPREY